MSNRKALVRLNQLFNKVEYELSFLTKEEEEFEELSILLNKKEKPMKLSFSLKEENNTPFQNPFMD